jgi:AraC-like DNA-binding protein
MTHNAEKRRTGPPLISHSGHAPAAAIELLDQLYGGNDLHCRPGSTDFGFQYVGIGDQRLQLRRLRLDGYLRGTLEAGDGVIVQWVTRGRARLSFGGETITTQPGSPPIIFPSGQPFQVEFNDVDQRLVHIDEDLLRSVTADTSLVGRPLSFQTHIPPTETAITQWAASVTAAVKTFRMKGPASSAWSTGKRDVAKALLQLYPLNPDLVRVPIRSQSDARFVAAMRYAHAHAHKPITVGDIAAAADISVRGVQESFRRHLQRSPMVYIREVRLDQARLDLQTATPWTDTVADIAPASGSAARPTDA